MPTRRRIGRGTTAEQAQAGRFAVIDTTPNRIRREVAEQQLIGILHDTNFALRVLASLNERAMYWRHLLNQTR